MRMLATTFAAVSLLAATGSSASQVSSNPVHVMTDKNCLITEFYGIPLNLKLSELSKLNVDYTRAYHNAEGNFFPEATLLVGNKILIQIEFSDGDDASLYQLKTSSHGAVGPGGIAIGATLKALQSNWPKGDFYWTQAHGEYVAFSNGTNVYFEFDPRDMPPGAFDLPPVPVQISSGEWVSPPRKKIAPDPQKLKVRSIRITSGENSEICNKSGGKK